MNQQSPLSEGSEDWLAPLADHFEVRKIRVLLPEQLHHLVFFLLLRSLLLGFHVLALSALALLVRLVFFFCFLIFFFSIFDDFGNSLDIFARLFFLFFLFFHFFFFTWSRFFNIYPISLIFLLFLFSFLLLDIICHFFSNFISGLFFLPYIVDNLYLVCLQVL